MQEGFEFRRANEFGHMWETRTHDLLRILANMMGQYELLFLELSEAVQKFKPRALSLYTDLKRELAKRILDEAGILKSPERIRLVMDMLQRIFETEGKR